MPWHGKVRDSFEESGQYVDLELLKGPKRACKSAVLHPLDVPSKIVLLIAMPDKGAAVRAAVRSIGMVTCLKTSPCLVLVLSNAVHIAWK